MLTRERANNEAIQLMQAEDQELKGINYLLPQNIQRVLDFKIESKELLELIEKNDDV